MQTVFCLADMHHPSLEQRNTCTRGVLQFDLDGCADGFGKCRDDPHAARASINRGAGPQRSGRAVV
jgi:hypothetical protein